ncbi:MAG: hypothetical protein IT357_12395 [Gemmatimonadaceae bacterium]|nr:hypothetical protein [Gemmatimonadaceae bacterium]
MTKFLAVCRATSIVALLGAIGGALGGLVVAGGLVAAALGVGVAVAIPGWEPSILVYPIVAAAVAAVRLRVVSARAAQRALPSGNEGNS